MVSDWFLDELFPDFVGEPVGDGENESGDGKEEVRPDRRPASGKS